MFKRIALLSALGLIAATSAQASSLLPGATIAATPLAYSGSPIAFFGGSLSTGVNNANYSAIVFTDPTNTFCAGCLDFVYNIDTQSAGAVSSLSFTSFTGTQLNVGYTGAGFAPSTISRSADGSTVTFSFGSGGIPNASLSTYFVVQTNATIYKSGTASLTSVTGFTSSGATSFSPLAPVPEPSTLLLMGSGLAGLAGAVKRRLFA